MTRLRLESRILALNVCVDKNSLEVEIGAPREKNWRLKFVKLGANIANDLFFLVIRFILPDETGSITQE